MIKSHIPEIHRKSSSRTSSHRSARRRGSTRRPSHRSCGRLRGVSRLHHQCDTELPWWPVLLRSFRQHWKCNLHEMWEERDGGPKFGLSSVWKVLAIKGSVTLNITKVKRIPCYCWAVTKTVNNFVWSVFRIFTFLSLFIQDNLLWSIIEYPGSLRLTAVRLGDCWVLLVVQNDVRSPDVICGDVETLHSSVLLRVPHQLVIPPELLNPQIGCHNLVLQVLKIGRKERPEVNNTERW